MIRGKRLGFVRHMFKNDVPITKSMFEFKFPHTGETTGQASLQAMATDWIPYWLKRIKIKNFISAPKVLTIVFYLACPNKIV